MELTLKNICKIREATIKLEGITIIAGENNTGKSTIGKVLFCIFNSFFKYEDQIYNFRKNNILSYLHRARMSTKYSGFLQERNLEEIAEELIKLKNNPNNLMNQLVENMLTGLFEDTDKDTKQELTSMVKKIIQSLEVSDSAIFDSVLTNKLNSEFHRQINNIYDKNALGEIHLFIKANDISITIDDNEISKVENRISLDTEIVYIDDPFVLDNNDNFLRTRYSYRRFDYESFDHKVDLEGKLFEKRKTADVIEGIITSEKLKNILILIQSVCAGEMITVGRENSFKSNSSDETLNIKNISTGLKTFIIIQRLLKNGTLEENGTIVLDEPEIHLHPEWQLIFAEIIVLLQKEFNMHILLTTHSPYFLQAIEVYAAKHKIADKCKYYLAENDANFSKISEVTDNIERIYSLLLTPLQKLENERYSDD